MTDIGLRRFGEVPVRIVGFAMTFLLVTGSVTVGPSSVANAPASVDEIADAGPAATPRRGARPVRTSAVAFKGAAGLKALVISGILG